MTTKFFRYLLLCVLSFASAAQAADGDYVVGETFEVGANVYVRALTLDKRRHILWVGTSVGLLEVDARHGNALRTFTRDNGLANEYVFATSVDSDGELWVGTNGGGVSRLNNSTWTTYFPMHGLADYWVYAFAQQDEFMWVGTWAGVSVINRRSGKIKNYVKELVNEWVYGVAVDSRQQVWLGTEGGVNMYDGAQWHTWTHEQGLGAPNNGQLPFSDNTGLGTRSRHDLSVLSQGQITYNPNYVFTLLVTPDDHVWAGTWGGGVSRFDGTTWHNLTDEDGLSGNIVYAIARDSEGGMWFGTNGGLSRYFQGKWQTYNKNNGLLDDNVYAIAAGMNGDMWVGTRNGVAKLVKPVK